MTREDYLARLEKLKEEVPDPWNMDKAADGVWELYCDIDLDDYQESKSSHDDD